MADLREAEVTGKVVMEDMVSNKDGVIRLDGDSSQVEEDGVAKEEAGASSQADGAPVNRPDSSSGLMLKEVADTSLISFHILQVFVYVLWYPTECCLIFFPLLSVLLWLYNVATDVSFFKLPLSCMYRWNKYSVVSRQLLLYGLCHPYLAFKSSSKCNRLCYGM